MKRAEPSTIVSSFSSPTAFRGHCISPSPDLEVFEALSVHFVEEEVWQLLAQLVEAEQETLHVAELQLGLLVCRVLSVLHLLWWQRHELLEKEKSHSKIISTLQS